MATLANLIVRIGASTDDFDKKVNAALGKVKRFGADMAAAGEALSVGFSLPVIAAGGFALKAAADMETLSKGLSTTMRSAEAAGKEMAALKELAKLPGLGLEEAVKGSIRLQTLGNSANESRRIMGELGNALAVVGGGREDFAEVVRQLTQMQSVGKVTKENLDTITERIPQISRIMIETWGPESVGDPAKFFERAGISSKEFIDIIVGKLAKGERAGNTFTNSFQNLKDAATQTAAEFGKSLLPIAQRVLDEFLTPGIEKAKALAEEFGKLPPKTQDAAISLTGILAVAPLVVVALGTMIEKWAVVTAAITKALPLLRSVAVAFGNMGIKAQGAGLVLGLMYEIWADEKNKAARKAAEDLEKFDQAMGLVKTSANAGYDSQVRFMRGLMDTDAAAKKAAASASEHGKKVGEASKTIHIANVADLVRVEILQRGKAAVEKAKDAVTDFLTAHEPWGKKLELAITPTEALAAATARYRLEIEGLLAPLYELKAIDFADLPKLPSDFGAIKNPPPPPRIGPVSNGVGPMEMMTEAQHNRIVNRHKQIGETAQKAMRQVSISTAITDTSRAITKLIFEGGKLKDVFKNVGLEIAKGFTQIVIEKGINLAIKAIGSLLSKFMDLGGVFGKIFGAGTSAANTAAGGAASAAGGIGSSVGGAAVSGITGIVGAVGSVVSAISGVVGNFQMAHMNTALGRIEESTRYMKIWMGEQSQNLLWCAQKSTEYLSYAVTALDAIGRFQSEMLANLQQLNGGGGIAMAGGGRNVSITINASGDPRAILEALTRELKQLGVVPR